MVSIVITINNLEVIITMYEFITAPHIQGALLIGVILALGASFLSPFLVLNGESLVADGLAHTSFLGFTIGLILVDSPIWIAIVVAIIAAILIKLIVNKLGVNADSAIGIISALSFAIGLIVIHKTRGFNVSIEEIMAGSILTTSMKDAILPGIIVVGIIAFVLVGYRKLFSVVYDYEYSRFSKINANIYSYILSVLTAVLIVVGVRVIGTLLISALIIFPALSASILKLSFKKTFIFGVIISVIAMMFGITLSHFLDVPTGAFVVVTNALILLALIIFSQIRKKVSR